jgi:hypothetical protein
MKYFEHTIPINPSSMTRWRKRVGESGAETLLKETIRAGLKLKAVKGTQLKRINVDTTVQEKAIRFPTDARLYDRTRERLVKAANERGIPLRQNYNRVTVLTLHRLDINESVTFSLMKGTTGIARARLPQAGHLPRTFNPTIFR